MPYPSPNLLHRITALYDTTWPILPPRIARAARLGWRWDEVSTPFWVEREGRVLAHAGVLEYDILVGGQRVPVAGVHAVCTDPDYRRQGLARQVLGEALAFCDAKGLPAVLATDVPDVYTPHGFATATEWRWTLPGRAPGPAMPTRGLRSALPEDVALLQGLLARRQPVSQRLASAAPPWMFGICEVLASDGFGHLHHAPALDAILAWEREGDTVVVWDVVAEVRPSLEDLLAHLPAGPVTLAFSVDQFGEDTVRGLGGTPVRSPSDDLWMVRGLSLPDGIWQMPILGRH